MEAVVWSDYLCPWCYVGRDRTLRLERLGVRVTPMPYELHPDIPPEGRRVRADGRVAHVLDRIESECEAAGLPFRRPTRVPNTRRALETAEVVRSRSESAFAALDDALFRAHFVDGLALDDVDVLDRLVVAAGLEAEDVRATVEAGEGRSAVDRSMRLARDAGVTATPAWLVDRRLVIPGALPAETMQRWVERMQATAAEASGGTATSTTLRGH